MVTPRTRGRGVTVKGNKSYKHKDELDSNPHLVKLPYINLAKAPFYLQPTVIENGNMQRMVTRIKINDRWVII